MNFPVNYNMSDIQINKFLSFAVCVCTPPQMSKKNINATIYTQHTVPMMFYYFFKNFFRKGSSFIHQFGLVPVRLKRAIPTTVLKERLPPTALLKKGKKIVHFIEKVVGGSLKFFFSP